MKNKIGKVLEEKEAIMNIWEKHFEELYNSQNPVDNALLSELPQRNEHEHTDKFLPEEVVCNTKPETEEIRRH